MAQGIGFYNIKEGVTRYARSEAQIQAYINSSDLGINASRDQDFGWRIDPEWVKRLRAFKKHATKMAVLSSTNNGRKPSDIQVLYAIYKGDLDAEALAAEEQGAPFEEEYLQAISSKEQPKVEEKPKTSKKEQ